MDKKDFRTSEELGLIEDDARFLSRFEANLSLERRAPQRKKTIWDGRTVIEATLWALAAAFGSWWFEPSVFAYLSGAFGSVDWNGSVAGLPLGVAVVTLVGIAAFCVSFWPQLVDDLVE